ncbi:MAG: Transglutaminase-like superfamily [Thermomicrobiales bacterium]|jgi:hypothetical protein|nr:Transglutaminase-like superfamily [Thermomicrobiales bacterium]
MTNPAPPASHPRDIRLSLSARRALVTAEALAWSALVRLLLATRASEGALRALDSLPRRAPRADPVPLPAEGPFRLAGACLGRSLARSQYLRTRGRPHVLVFGVRGGAAAFAAHAWLEGDPVDPAFLPLRRVPR